MNLISSFGTAPASAAVSVQSCSGMQISNIGLILTNAPFSGPEGDLGPTAGNSQAGSVQGTARSCIRQGRWAASCGAEARHLSLSNAMMALASMEVAYLPGLLRSWEEMPIAPAQCLPALASAVATVASKSSSRFDAGSC